VDDLLTAIASGALLVAKLRTAVLSESSSNEGNEGKAKSEHFGRYVDYYGES
jgi:hypothetical protein